LNYCSINKSKTKTSR